MDKQEIYSYLCYYDKRNPDSYLDEMTDEEIKAAQKDCSCDNCFYGRTKLANELIGSFSAEKLKEAYTDGFSDSRYDFDSENYR